MLPFDSNVRLGAHDKTLAVERAGITHYQELWERSIFNIVHMYNCLPQSIVDLPSVAAFQGKLTHLVRTRAVQNRANWRQAFQNALDVLFQFYGSDFNAWPYR